MYPLSANHGLKPALIERARVLVIGMGALGCPAASSLVTSLGASSQLTVIDPDQIELSNLQRQPLFDDADIGAQKAAVAVEKLAVDTVCTLTPIYARFDANNADELVARHDYVIDATDDPTTKFLINDVCVRLSVPFSYAGVVRTGGQAMAVVPGTTACLRCVFPDGPDSAEDDRGSCSNQGILAPVAGVIGALAAVHAIEHLCGAGRDRATMTIYELRGTRFRRVTFDRRHDCCACTSTATSETKNVSHAPGEPGLSNAPNESGLSTPRSCEESDASVVVGADLRSTSTCHS